ncbi:hypothetical protein V8G54_016260 [Vigna mungo]|uniref:Uncharacterized protein n=1 Tax=Vigna mungo TaxID=3915 RepID=A0AAQ3NJY1_VIGMU
MSVKHVSDPDANITNRILRCTGFKPSRTSGKARPRSTDMAYAISVGTTLPSLPLPLSIVAVTLPFPSLLLTALAATAGRREARADMRRCWNGERRRGWDGERRRTRSAEENAMELKGLGQRRRGERFIGLQFEPFESEEVRVCRALRILNEDRKEGFESEEVHFLYSEFESEAREKANTRVSLAPSHPSNLPHPKNVSVQAWFIGVPCDEVVSVLVTDGIGSFDWNCHRQRRVLSYCRLHLLTHPSVGVLCPSECRRRRLPTHSSCSVPPTKRRWCSLKRGRLYDCGVIVLKFMELWDALRNTKATQCPPTKLRNCNRLGRSMFVIESWIVTRFSPYVDVVE